MTEICFIEARPRNAVTGEEVVVRLAGGGSDTPYHRADEHYRAGIVEMPRFRAAFGFDDDGWTGGTVPTSGVLGFMPGDTSLVASLSELYWRDAAITLDAGDERAPLVRRLTGAVADIANNEGQLALTLVDPSKLLDKPVLGTGFDGSGGLEGPAEAAGRVKRRSLGLVFNVQGDLLDKANNIFEFGDPARQFAEFLEVRDKGRAGPLVELDWQGSIEATFAALQAVDVPQGGCVAAPSIACVKWWTVPAGPLTADIQGEIAGGYADTPVAIAARLLAAVDGPVIDGLAAADALRPATSGIHIATSTDTVAEVLDRLLLGCSLYWVLQSVGTIRIGEWAWTAPVAAFQAVFIGRERQLPPIKSRQVGYHRNHRVHQASEISVAAPSALVVQPFAPSASASFPGQTWQADDGRYWNRRADNHISVGGRRIMVGGKLATITWTPNASQPVRTIAEAAAAAAAQASEAYAAANEAIDGLIGLADDGILSINEKITKLVPEAARLDLKWTALSASAAALGVDSAAAAAARAAWLALLGGLTPAWNDTDAPTPVVRSAYDAARDGYDGQLEQLDKAIKAEAAKRASWADVTGAGKPEDNADVTANSQVTVIPPSPSTITIARTWDAQIKAGQLPITLAAMVMRGDADISKTNDVGYALAATGGLNGQASVDNTNGSSEKGFITLPDTITAPGTAALTVTVGAASFGPFAIELKMADDPPPAANSVGGGTDSSLAAVASSSFVVMTGTHSGDVSLDVAIGGPGDTLRLGVSTTYTLSTTSAAVATLQCVGQYSLDGSTWTDMGSAVTGDPATVEIINGKPLREAGWLSADWSVTGLAAGTYKVRLMGRRIGGAVGTLNPLDGRAISSKS